MHALERLATYSISVSSNSRQRWCINLALAVSLLIGGLLLAAPEVRAQNAGAVIRAVARAPSSATSNLGLQAAAATTYDMLPSNYQTVNYFNSVYSFTLYLISSSTGAPIPNAQLVIKSITPRAFSGGHDHNDSSRPKGSLDRLTGNTGADGQQFLLNYTAPEFAGVTDFEADCAAPVPGYTCIPGTFQFTVGNNGLVDLGPAMDYELTGSFGQAGVSSMHTNNHFATASFAAKLRALATTYYLKYQASSSPKLRYNDISLEGGGLFDVFNNWSTPHKEHRIGISMDLGLVHPARYTDLLKFMQQLGITGKTYVEGNHYHVRESGSSQ